MTFKIRVVSCLFLRVFISSCLYMQSEVAAYFLTTLIPFTFLIFFEKFDDDLHHFQSH